MVAETNAHVDSLNLAIQAARLDLEQLGRAKASIGGHEQAYVGDHVVTRRNDRTLRTDQDQPIRNRDRWTVQAIGRDGSLTVAHHGGEGVVTLPADYAREHVRLGYAATAHGNQGDTVTVDSPSPPRPPATVLYVSEHQGRDENCLLFVADDLGQAPRGPRTSPQQRRSRRLPPSSAVASCSNKPTADRATLTGGEGPTVELPAPSPRK